MENNVQRSVLNLDGMAFDEIQYKRDIEGELSTDYEMNFKRIVKENHDGVHYAVTLIANIWSADKKVTMKVSLTGFFSCVCDDQNLKNTLINDNTVAILFPYLRSQVSLVSTQPYIPPIVIPPVNIVSMFKDSPEEAE